MMSSSSSDPRRKRRQASRVTYDEPTRNPIDSIHRRRLVESRRDDQDDDEERHRHRDDDDDDANVVRCHEGLLRAFAQDVISLDLDDDDDLDDVNHATRTTRKTNEEKYRIVADWSVIVGYCESMTTNVDESRRYSPFPLPLRSLRQLIELEFVPLLRGIDVHGEGGTRVEVDGGGGGGEESMHRRTVRAVSNAIWGR